MTDDTNPFPPSDILDFTGDFGLASTSLTQELERLQEGTIFSILNDFGDDGALLSGFVDPNKVGSCTDNTPAINDFLRSLVTSDPNASLPEASNHVEHRSSIVYADHALKKTSAVTDNGQYLWSCVEHDHSYCADPDREGGHMTSSLPPQEGHMTSSLPPQEGHVTSSLPPLAAEMDTSTEEENSDTGYETTSPVVANSALVPPNATPSSSSLPAMAVQGHVQNLGDPVALIDSRIKHFMDSQQVCLTEEEKETLRAEGMPIPTTLPLTKVEEKALKAVRRKLRNKVAAHESRKKKKEYVYALEDRVRQCTTENLRLQKKLESLESENKSLVSQLRRLQSLMAKGALTAAANHKGAVLTVIVLCFAVLLGGWVPMKSSWSRSNDYTTTAVRSRVLLSVDSAQTFHNSNWLWHYIFGEEAAHLCHSDPKLPQYGCYSQALLDMYTALTPATSTDTNDTHTALSPAA
eukprot:Em0016g420a